MRRIAFALLITPLLGILAVAVEAGTLRVANNGIDSDTCGGVSAPCRSVSRAIGNAADGDTIVVGPGRYGDLNGDGNFGGPGEEGGPAGCACMIEVNKQLTLQSSDGAGVTVLDASGADISGMVVSADGVILGGQRRGFTIINARRWGLVVNANGVTVAGNLASGNGINGNVAFSIHGTGNIVVDNAAINNANTGFQIGGDGSTVTGNVASGNLQGFDVSASGQFTQNVASGNRTQGLAFNGSGLEIRRNSILGNRGLGIWLFNSNVTITENNIFGNGSNCGLQNNTGASVTASGNFWGATTGPGTDPADAVCDEPGSTTIVEPVATQPFHINVRIGL